jgi:integrase
MAKLETPTRSSLVRTAMQGIRRRHGTAPRQAQAVRLDTLRRLLEMTRGEGPAATRDRAVLLLGFAGGFRRSELAALQVTDLEVTEAGLRVSVRASKTDPEAAGAEVGIPRGRHPQTCPVTAVVRWIGVAGISAGPLFRRVDRWDRVHATRGLTPEAIALILKRALRRAELPVREFAGHSLRAGFATEAAAQGASERAIMRHGRWRSVTTVRRYIRSGELFTENPAAVLGL